MSLTPPQNPSLRSSRSADTRYLSASPPYCSDGNLSTSSSTGSLKRRRSDKNNKKELFIDTKEPSEEIRIDLTQKKLKGLHLQQNNQYRSLSYQVGDQVEAIKWTNDVKEWYCARVVEILYDTSTAAGDALIFVHYEGWSPDEADWISPTLIRLHNPRTSLQYGPKGPESDRSWKDYAEFYKSKAGEQARHHTGLVQDRRMSLHCCPCHSRETIHPERPDRISSILQALHANRLLRYFGRVHAREATVQELLRVHTYGHVRNYYPIDEERESVVKKRPLKITSIAALLNPEPPAHKPNVMRGVGGGTVKQADQDHIKRQHTRFSSAAAAADATQTDPKPVAPPGLICEMTCGELGIAVDTTFHPLYTSLSARIAAGSLLSLVESIVNGRLRNGFALIRPPGHHAEDDTAMGFCFYNNVAVAVADTLEKYPSKIKKILIIDWDIHHGNGTQKMFYDNPNVLYISLHRWDRGKFYPFTGAPEECGEGPGLGNNVNIAFSSSEDKPRPMGDTEFVAAFYYFVIPIARQFHPDMIFVSAGFDAAEGHPENLGGYNMTPRGYALLTKMVKDLANELCDGRLALTLEGGYELQPLASSCAASVAQLLPLNTLPDQQITTFKRTLNAVKPNMGAVESFAQVAFIQKKYWNLSDAICSPSFKFNLPSDWRATDSISTRPKRDKKPIKVPVVEGY
ncbi:hypothetical protein G6F70_000192 [Rhizopus microsporus]|uniref:histone deacetylase n=4 Tax=Rhizopus TaxID=4842 RepID=A0A1X0S903_RHIZD|nr:hypothetical protein G6F71_001472 [Rhizopus microsporus]KAG1204740.1 hypothetical protein G6F70_000192 [Rhizopus microsporus]KAG1216090.1 hypothetical protein G6F69_000410 [Rhizopus microsporus]KAG1237060.1 hypothetical protein G6F67_001478 [Rhizopus microsporus]KAG1269673.1 hypothetical protein G6F68_000091 [Rhizopus microsporus]